MNATKSGTVPCGRKLASSLESHLQGRPGSGLGELEVQVRADEQGKSTPAIKVEALSPRRFGKRWDDKDEGDGQL